MESLNNPQRRSKTLIVVCGPTASGKTGYALRLAKEKNGELISADSRQVYKYLNIGTGKDIDIRSKFKDQRSKLQIKNNNYTVGYYVETGVPLWLYDVVTPDQQFSAFEYAQIARIVIRDIWKRGKTPMLVGGTGLYINAVVDGFDMNAPPDWKLRGALEDLNVKDLQKKLRRLNPTKINSMNNSDKNNPRRLIRAIEIAENKKLQTQKKGRNIIKPINTMVNFIGLKSERKELYSQIDKRVDKRLDQGVLNEIKSVLKRGYSWDDPGLNTLGYKQLRPYFENNEPLQEAIQKWKFKEHDYARRQLTWFNKDRRIQWITI